MRGRGAFQRSLRGDYCADRHRLTCPAELVARLGCLSGGADKCVLSCNFNLQELASVPVVVLQIGERIVGLMKQAWNLVHRQTMPQW